MTKQTINAKTFILMLHASTQTMLKFNPGQDYNTSDLMYDTAHTIIEHYGLNMRHYEQLQQIRAAHDQSVREVYGVTLTGGIKAMFEDAELVLKQAGVPQHVRIVMGLFDNVIGAIVTGK